MNVEYFLQQNNIEFRLYEHPAVYTTEDLAKYSNDFRGLACKNLLLKDQKSKRFFLVILPAAERIDVNKMASLVGEKKLSFASSENLKQVLGVEPGAVSPFALLNDAEQKTEVYIKKEVLDAEYVSFHPNRNTASLELSGEMFQKYLGKLTRPIQSF